jgi:hypothetical protein
VRLSANCRCPERRSDDGRTILECTRTGLKSWSDLVLLVELSGLEPLTSCMPYPAKLSGTDAGLGMFLGESTSGCCRPSWLVSVPGVR